VTLADDHGLRRPMAHETLFVPASIVHVPRLEAADVAVRQATCGSVTVTACPSDGPALVAVRV
jgi:hypothetical protein